MQMSSRSRVRPAAATSQASTAPTGDQNWMKRGAAGVAAIDVEKQRQADNAAKRQDGFMPFRFYLKVGEEADIIILDKSLDEVPFFHEHQLKDKDGKWSIHEACPKEWDHCPICDGAQGGKESYYVMMLSILDLRGYTNSKGVMVPHSRKLLPVKTGAMDDFVRLHDAAKAKHGTMRGMHLLLARDQNSGTNIGRPIMLPDSTMYEIVSEQEMTQEFGHPAVVGSRDGKVLKEANADLHSYDYGKLFPKPDGADLRARYGGNAPAGSTQEQAGAWGDAAQGQAQPTQAPAGAAPPARTRLRAAAGSEQTQAQPAAGGTRFQRASRQQAVAPQTDDGAPWGGEQQS